MTFDRRLAACRPSLHIVAVGALLACSAATCAAASQTTYLEQSQTYAVGTRYQSFRVPTTDADGKVNYYDITVQLSVDATGAPVPTAAVTSKKSPKFNGNKVIPGTYLDIYGTACTVETTTVDSGRQEGSFTCSYSAQTEDITATWFNGPIKGSPYEAQLEAAGIDKLSDWQDFAWGLVGSTYGGYSAWACFKAPGILSATQVGSKLTLAFFNTANTQLCAMTLTLQTP